MLRKGENLILRITTLLDSTVQCSAKKKKVTHKKKQTSCPIQKKKNQKLFLKRT